MLAWKVRAAVHSGKQPSQDRRATAGGSHDDPTRQKDDAVLFERLYRSWWEEVRGMARTVLGSDDDAQDAA
jgi:hypothetical protein